MAITYDAPSNTITVTEFTEGTPCTFQDIFDADEAGGWGVITKQQNQYHWEDGYLHIGDDVIETWFADEGIQLFMHRDADYDVRGWISVKLNAHFRLGKLDDESKKATSNGCHVLTYVTTGSQARYHNIEGAGEIYLYSSVLQGDGNPNAPFSVLPDRAWNCILHGYDIINMYDYGDFFNCLITWRGFNTRLLAGTYDRLEFYGVDYVIRLGYPSTSTSNISNLFSRNHTNLVYVQQPFEARTVVLNLINPDVDAWTFYWMDPTYNVTVNRQYTFNLKVTDIDGIGINQATVTLKDKNGSQVFQVTTDINGDIVEQIVTRGWYEVATGDSLNDLSPHNLTIARSGYKPYEVDFTLDKVDWIIALTKRNPHFGLLEEKYLKGEID